MKPVLASAMMFAAASSAAFAARPDVRAYTCEQGKALIAQSGAVVVTTGANTYDRIVHNRGFCAQGQEAIQELVQTQDDPRCRIGYTCRDKVITK